MGNLLQAKVWAKSDSTSKMGALLSLTPQVFLTQASLCSVLENQWTVLGRFYETSAGAFVTSKPWSKVICISSLRGSSFPGEIDSLINLYRGIDFQFVQGPSCCKNKCDKF